MAVDQALFAAVQQGAAPSLRFYRWEPACLSFGRHQKTLGVYDPMRARAAGIDVVRRPTGGLAVLHHQELTYAVIAPAALLGGPRAAYLRINEALVAGLRTLGVSATIGAGAQTHVPSPDALHPCFERPAPGEVVAAGRKLVGSAQRVERHTILQHGSILLDGDQGDVIRLQYDPLPHVRGETTIRELTGAVPPWPDLLAHLVQAFERVLGTCLAPAPLDRETLECVAEEEERFRSEEWTWRR